MLAFGICRRRPLSICWRTASFQRLRGNAAQHHRRWQASLMQMRITRSTSPPSIRPVRRGEHLKPDWRRANCLFCLQETTTLLPRALSQAAVRRSDPRLSPAGSGPAPACAAIGGLPCRRPVRTVPDTTTRQRRAKHTPSPACSTRRINEKLLERISRIGHGMVTIFTIKLCSGSP